MADEQLDRFVDAQKSAYDRALTEIRQGRKRSHWMWYIFPQLKGLGHSSMAKQYGIDSLEEAAAYLKHPLLGPRLVEISRALLQLATSDALAVFGNPDNLKILSSMTLFASVPQTDPVFGLVIEKYFNGQKDGQTLNLLGHQKGDAANG